ncbi:uncharacterized protein LOC143447307 isoform X2 [Clavelina lepadiformis]|uniref:uncharacterized protein LOC143447307 isoform X2 n=1 Tax=Clavelina lepadiformis TaxID=159417 RepID=UPI00404222EF
MDRGHKIRLFDDSHLSQSQNYQSFSRASCRNISLWRLIKDGNNIHHDPTQCRLETALKHDLGVHTLLVCLRFCNIYKPLRFQLQNSKIHFPSLKRQKLNILN